MSDRATIYTYDDNGNLIKMVAPDKSALYVYDANNRLIKATVQDGSSVIVEEYTYDFVGSRTSKATTTDSGFDFTKYVLDTNCDLTQVLAELNADGTEKAYYTRGADLISQERDGKVSYYLYDGHGSVRMLADENGNVTDTYDYDAFGNLINSTGNTVNNYRYCGEQFDGTTGLYYLRARYMNPNTGTFISMDSYNGSINDPVSLHKYLYANANPVTYSDPSGNAAVEGSLAVALAGDEYALTRLSIEMTTSEMGYYSRTPSEVVRHVATVIAVGVAIIAALTGIVVGMGYMYDHILLIIEAISEGTSISPTIDYRTDVTTDACPDPENKPKDKKSDDKNYTVYRLVDKGTKKVEYVGRTGDFEATKKRHANNPYRCHLDPEAIAINLTLAQSRGLEQYYIEYYSTLNRNKDNPIHNQINGVNPNNISKYNYYMQVASDYLESLTYVG